MGEEEGVRERKEGLWKEIGGRRGGYISIVLNSYMQRTNILILSRKMWLKV